MITMGDHLYYRWVDYQYSIDSLPIYQSNVPADVSAKTTYSTHDPLWAQMPRPTQITAHKFYVIQEGVCNNFHELCNY